MVLVNSFLLSFSTKTILKKIDVTMFNINQKYSRKTVAEKFEDKIFESSRLGKWDTTLVSHDDNLVIFMNINVPGKSGHFFYNNYNRSTKEVNWYGRPGTHSDQPLMQRLIKNQSLPFIFARWNNSDDFTFIGRGNYISHENGAIGFDPDKNEIETLKVNFSCV